MLARDADILYLIKFQLSNETRKIIIKNFIKIRYSIQHLLHSNTKQKLYCQNLFNTILLPLIIVRIVDLLVDRDMDGYILTDCNDNDPAFNPGAIDISDNLTDEDCNGDDLLSAIVNNNILCNKI